jgi:uncharacterized protein with GYD domain
MESGAAGSPRRGQGMPTYVVLYKFTDQGAKDIKSTVKRARESRAENEKRGFRMQGVYWTQGQYDVVAIVEAPSEDAMMAGLLNRAPATSAAKHCGPTTKTKCKRSSIKCDSIRPLANCQTRRAPNLT